MSRAALAALLSVLTSTCAIAAEPLGLYVGAGAGSARESGEQWGDKRGVGWTAFAGLRPYRNLGIELQHLDFGHAAGTHETGQLASDRNGNARSTALFGMGVLPLSPVELYAKIGVGALQQTTNYSRCSLVFCDDERRNKTEASFGWGLGAQLKWSSLALRGEFVQFRTDGRGDPELLALSLLWSF